MENTRHQNRPRVSVIIPAYNHEAFVAQSIDSVLNQTFQDFEVIITNDGSSDNTASVIESYSDPRIRFFNFGTNRGACAVINIGLQHTQGEYVSILNSDDLFLPTKLETQVHFLDRHPEYGAIFSDAQLIDENNQPFNDVSHPHYNLFNQPNKTRFEWLNYFFYKENCLCHPTILIRSKCYDKIGLFNESYAQLPDFEFWVRLLQYYDIYISPEKLIQFRILNQAQNTSGPRPEVISRASWEHRHILEWFLDMEPTDFSLVFPEYDGPEVITRDDVAFQLAQLALKGNVHHDFAIDVLYNLKKRNAEISSELSHADLIHMTGKFGNIYTSRIFELEQIADKMPDLERYIRELEKGMKQQERNIHSLEDHINSLESHIDSLYQSTSWRLTGPVRWLSGKLKNLKIKNEPHHKLPSGDMNSFSPLISIIIHIEQECGKTPAKTTIDSVLEQFNNTCQLIILYEGLKDDDIYTTIKSIPNGNKRIIIVEAAKDQTAEQAKNLLLNRVDGEYLLWLNAGDKLNEMAINRLVDQLKTSPDAKIVYTDEACFDDSGKVFEMNHKPDWNPSLFLSTPYFEKGTLICTDILKQIGGFDFSYRASFLYDALLKSTEIIAPEHIYHIPEVLLLSHGSIDRNKEAVFRQDQDIRALKAAMKRRQSIAHISQGEAPSVYRLQYQLPAEPPLVTIIILTKNRYDLLSKCIKSILDRTSYDNYDILIVDNGSDESETLQYLDALSKKNQFKIIRDDRPFNFSALTNSAVKHARGDFITMLNNDIEVINTDWLQEMVSQAVQPGVGAVGARLWYPDNTLQHGGVIFILGLAGHAHRFLKKNQSGYFGRAVAIQNFSAVTAACLVMKKELFEQVGGMNEKKLPVAYNDIDLCLKLTEAGYCIVWTPYAELYHHESASRGDDRQTKHRKRAAREYEYMIKNWGTKLENDPAYNKNLPQDRENFFPEGFFPSDKKNEMNIFSTPDNNESGILKDRLQAVETELEAIQNSTSWRITAPLRAISTYFHRFMVRFHIRPFGKKGHTQIKNSNQLSLEELKIKEKQTFESELQSFLGKDSELKIPTSDKPKVSIILILYNQAALTFRCLCSLALERNVPIEVIVIDNHSRDDTDKMMKRVSGIKYVYNNENVGFLKAVNQAADMASGDHILLFNNDAALLPGTLSNSVSRLESDEKIGAVGGKIILVDGSLQEAGSIIWQDGTCLGYGRGRSPDDPEFQFLRSVDYCSGAFLLIHRELFENLSRFDEDYAPAYYEESDFCLRLTKAGYKIVYDPCVEILHYEFGSSEATEHVLELQHRNRKKLLSKHKNFLNNKYSSSTQKILEARDVTQYKGRVLFIEDRVPHEFLGAGYPRCRTIVNALIELNLFVTFYPLQFPKDDWAVTYKTLPPQVEVMLNHGIETFEEFLEERGGYYDYVLISRPHNMEVVKYIHDTKPQLFNDVKIIYDAEAIFTLREIRQHELQGSFYSPSKIQKKLDEEMNLTRIAQDVITVSHDEAEHFKRSGCDNVHVLSHTIKPRPTPAKFIDRKGLLFVGSLNHDNSPNVDSIIWFVEKIMPELSKISDRQISLTIVGGAGSRQLKDLKSEQIRFTGRVDSLTPYFNKARVFIIPTRFAAGVPHKAHEAASHGLPMVTTGLIARQLGWERGKDLLFSDDPTEFAKDIMQLYDSKILWHTLKDNAMDKIRNECSKDKFISTLSTIFK